MEKISLTLETITPLFLSGNDQNTVEFRAASIRGQLRYWYRALLGGLGIIKPGRLHELESQVFGKEDSGSRVLIRLRTNNPAKIKKNSELGLGADRPGMTYLLYSTQLGENKRPYFDVGTEFVLDLCCFDKDVKKWLKLAGCSLWCWTHFGGLGTRSRRGGGDVQVKRLNDHEQLLSGLPSFTLQGVKDSASLKEHLESGLRKAFNVICELSAISAKPITGAVDFPIMHPAYTDIWIANENWNDVFTAMEQVGEKFRKFRFKRKPDFPSVLHEYLNKGIPPNLERPAFGLPLQFRYRSVPNKQAIVECEHFGRRASPLLFRFLRLDNGKVYLVLIYFKSSFLPDGERLKIRDQSKGARQRDQFTKSPMDTTQQNLLEGFRDQFSGYLEVRGWL